MRKAQLELGSPLRSRTTRAILSGAFVLAAGACADFLSSNGDVPDRIVFVSTREGVVNPQGGPTLDDIYIMDADGSGVENLSRDPSEYAYVNVTPDGRTIIFAAFRPYGSSWTGGQQCPQRVWTMTVGGASPKGVSGIECADRPVLSPDGGKFMFESIVRGEGDDFTRTIFVADIDGGNRRNVSLLLPPTGSGCTPTPTWSVRPHAWIAVDRVVFSRHICGVGTTYYSVNADGTDLLEYNVYGESSYLSPTGTRIAYDRVVGAPAREVAVINVNGSGVQGLVPNGELPLRFNYERSPWSPDGTELYFTLPSVGDHVLNVDLAESRLVSASPPGSFCGWSPRGDRMVFAHYAEGGTSNVWVMNADGTGRVNLTNSAAENRMPVWVPR